MFYPIRVWKLPFLAGFGGLIWWIFLIILAISIIDLLLTPDHSQEDQTQDQAMEKLKQRYVEGQISRSEFEQKKKALS